MTNTTDFYIKQFNRRRSWEVIDVDPNQKINPAVTRTLQKALAVSALELPVGDFITEEIAKHKELEKPVYDLLMANAEDEVKHDQALNNLKKVLAPLPEDVEFMEGVVNRADELANLMSPITVAGALEVSVFFVVLPMFRFLGSSAFRTVANDISNDETIHVATNINLADDWGYKRRPALNNLRKDIIEWLVSDLPNTHESKYQTRLHWFKASANLYRNGTSEELLDTKRAVMPSFFEKSNHDLPVYG